MISSQLEILVFTNTHLTSQLPSGKNELNQNRSADYNSLADACWNGFFKDALPELYAGVSNKKMTLWNVKTARHFLELEYGEYPKTIDPVQSVNPYCFLTQVIPS
jgi:hypothetical protein